MPGVEGRVGSKGDPGVNGAYGRKGKTGSPGMQGVMGVSGDRGKPGTDVSSGTLDTLVFLSLKTVVNVSNSAAS